MWFGSTSLLDPGRAAKDVVDQTLARIRVLLG
jgi:hypothetical protein